MGFSREAGLVGSSLVAEPPVIRAMSIRKRPLAPSLTIVALSFVLLTGLDLMRSGGTKRVEDIILRVIGRNTFPNTVTARRLAASIHVEHRRKGCSVLISLIVLL
jgi:hypothetical protein